MEMQGVYDHKRKELSFLFMKKVFKTPNCWFWLGYLMPNGYGQTYAGGGAENCKIKLAHVLAYELFVGEIPKGLTVLHECDIRQCVNPNHLLLGSYADNIHDSISKGTFFPYTRREIHA